MIIKFCCIRALKVYTCRKEGERSGNEGGKEEGEEGGREEGGGGRERGGGMKEDERSG